MNLSIEPYKSVSQIVFGSSTDDLRTILGHQYKSVNHYDSSGFRDVYIDLGLHVHYDGVGQCEAVEISPPAIPMFFDINFLGMPFNNAKEKMRKLDPDILVNNTGFTSLKYGINVYADGVDEDPNAPIEAVLVFRKGYYDDILNLLGEPEND